MNIIEIEETLGILRNSITENSTQIEEAKINICKAQNILQKWVEINYEKQNWKHLNMQYKSQSFY
jgi:flagellar biosynthesis chaperone FliJ